MLLNWCLIDPVSQKETNRNNAVYAIQQNRNPYIDHPEWILAIWGPTAGIDQLSSWVDVNIFPNPAGENITISVSTTQKQVEKIEIYSFTSSLVKSIDKPKNENTINISDLAEGIYTAVIYCGDNITRKKISVIR